MLSEIGSVGMFAPHLEDRSNAKPKSWVLVIVHKVKDPRATILQDLAQKLFEKFGHDKYYDIAVEMERVIEKSSQEFIRILTLFRSSV